MYIIYIPIYFLLVKVPLSMAPSPLIPPPWRIHGAGIYANMTGVYWWDPWHTIYSSTVRIRHGLRRSGAQKMVPDTLFGSKVPRGSAKKSPGSRGFHRGSPGKSAENGETMGKRMVHPWVGQKKPWKALKESRKRLGWNWPFRSLNTICDNY